VNSAAKVLTHEIIDEVPENLGAHVALVGTKLIFSPVLMNAKDSFSIKTLISDFEGNPSIDGRINGVKLISEYKESQWLYAITLLISLILIGIGTLNLKNQGMIGILGVDIGATLIITGYVLMVIGMLKSKRFLSIVRNL
jgi:hypothetical protein